MKYRLLLIALVMAFTLQSQNAFNAGENLTFTASYNMSGLLTDIAQVTMQTEEVKTSKSTLLHLKCTAKTFTKWDNFFRVRDLYESYVNPNSLSPYLYKRDINEGSYYKFMKYTFNHKSKSVSSLQKKRRKDGTFWEEKKTHSIKANTKDLVTTIYHLRNLDIHKASPGDSDSFPVIFDREERNVMVTYLSKETIKTAIGEKECYKLAINISDSDVLKGDNNNLLWLTADDNKIPVYAKFKIAVGNGELRIKSATGLKN
ncbi:MAG: DUF3108 domain-containing protein [Flavobacteriaceae bacterium]|nr:DUF3108 domain-containing protein [Bacteroidia bacterium]NNK28985.1 DUF3108 domain-containing protein [Flavobacteriaceae bacterium]NNL61221.1 DUF3108 domain-containing protein [Flavobacteriaceae bacterium]RZV65786.1 MAG: DUF3108 domain-containing protein [Flavobacteriaceae bacterium]